MKHIVLRAALVAVCLAVLTGANAALAQTGNIWRIDYFSNPNWAGAPAQTDFSPWIALNWGLGSPGPNVPVDNFTARMTTDAFFPAGIYQFSVVADDEVALMIDGATQVDTRGRGQSGKAFALTIPIAQGVHRIEVLYREWVLDAYVFVNWAQINNSGIPPVGPVPPIALPYPPLPPSQPSVQTSRGDYTPCIQQHLHQVNCFVSDGTWDGPNEGSIALEPQIVSWTNCEADTIMTFRINNEARSFACSRTTAGWFPR
jgi:hypothetical protein